MIQPAIEDEMIMTTSQQLQAKIEEEESKNRSGRKHQII